MLRNDTIGEVCRENHRDFVYVFAPWWSYHHDGADGTDLLLLVKLIPGFYPLCLGHCISHCQYVGTVAEYKISLLLLLTVGFGDFFFFCAFCKPFFSLVPESCSSTTDVNGGKSSGENDGF